MSTLIYYLPINQSFSREFVERIHRGANPFEDYWTTNHKRLK